MTVYQQGLTLDTYYEVHYFIQFYGKKRRYAIKKVLNNPIFIIILVVPSFFFTIIHNPLSEFFLLNFEQVTNTWSSFRFTPWPYLLQEYFLL